MPRPGRDWFNALAKPWRVAIVLLAAAPVMGIAIGLQRMYIAGIRQERVDWADVLVAHVSYWVAWAIVGVVLVPVVLRVIALERQPRLLVWLELALLGAVAVSLQPAVDLAQRFTIFPPAPEAPFQSEYIRFTLVVLPHSALVFGVIVGLTYAMWYYEHYRERELAASQLTAQLANARLDALRAQLNPHFLFNAMNTIAMLVRRNGNDQAVRMLAGLSDLLRYALDDSLPQEIPFGQELEFIERYLSIEQVRFQNRLHVEIDIDDRARGALVPTLLLQPIVENAIRHGIGRRRAAGLVRIAARVIDASVVIEVRDDGPGVKPGIRRVARTGVGLRNTEARLAQIYGDSWSFDLVTPPEGGTVATIRLPHRLAVASVTPRPDALAVVPRASDAGRDRA